MACILSQQTIINSAIIENVSVPSGGGVRPEVEITNQLVIWLSDYMMAAYQVPILWNTDDIW